MSQRRGLVAVPLFTAALAAPLAVVGGHAQATSAQATSAPAAVKRPVPAVATYGAESKVRIYSSDGALRHAHRGFGDVGQIALAPGLLVGTA